MNTDVTIGVIAGLTSVGMATAVWLLWHILCEIRDVHRQLKEGPVESEEFCATEPLGERFSEPAVETLPTADEVDDPTSVAVTVVHTNTDTNPAGMPAVLTAMPSPSKHVRADVLTARLVAEQEKLTKERP